MGTPEISKKNSNFKFFKDRFRGFGFIQSGENDYFIHYNNIQSSPSIIVRRDDINERYEAGMTGDNDSRNLVGIEPEESFLPPPAQL